MPTPPPYLDITGIYTTDDKHQAISKVDYDGLAKPGQLVVDTTDYSVWVGDDTGALNPVSGSAGLPLANGTSNFNIATTDGNITITANSSETWTFDTDGDLTIPGYIYGLGTINIDNQNTGTSADINLNSADNITLQGKDHTVAGGEREGGDININGGDGSPGITGDFGGTGGDINITAGNGGNADDLSAGDSGFININCGTGGAANVANAADAGDGRDLTLSAGSAGNNGGNNVFGGSGGAVIISAGDSTQIGNQGFVQISAGVDDTNTPGLIYLGNGSNQLIYAEQYATLRYTPVALGTLPSAVGIGGTRAFIVDSSVAASGNFGAIAATGGSNIVPVFSDGTNWLIG